MDAVSKLTHAEKMILQQTVCLVVNQITVGNFAFLFNP